LSVNISPFEMEASESAGPVTAPQGSVGTMDEAHETTDWSMTL
jgi:hypothetical protein